VPTGKGQNRKKQEGDGSRRTECKRVLGEFAALGEGHDTVGGAEGQRHDGHRGLAAPDVTRLLPSHRRDFLCRALGDRD